MKETGDSRYVSQNEKDKTCFQHDLAYGDFRFSLGEQLLKEHYMIHHSILLNIQNVMDIKKILLQRFISFSTKKYADGLVTRDNKSGIKIQIVPKQ